MYVYSLLTHRGCCRLVCLALEQPSDDDDEAQLRIFDREIDDLLPLIRHALRLCRDEDATGPPRGFRLARPPLPLTWDRTVMYVYASQYLYITLVVSPLAGLCDPGPAVHREPMLPFLGDSGPLRLSLRVLPRIPPMTADGAERNAPWKPVPAAPGWLWLFADIMRILEGEPSVYQSRIQCRGACWIATTSTGRHRDLFVTYSTPSRHVVVRVGTP